MKPHKSPGIDGISIEIYVIGIINDILPINTVTFHFLHIMRIWQETACDKQIAS